MWSPAGRAPIGIGKWFTEFCPGLQYPARGFLDILGAVKNGPSLNSTAGTDGATSTVLLLYEDMAAGQRAMRLFERLNEQVHDEIELQPQLWRFDLLEDTEWRALAQADAANAHLIVVATRSDIDLPAGVKSWLAAWCANSIPGSSALVALLSSQRAAGEGESPVHHILHFAARQAGQDFFAQEVRATSLKSDMSVEAIRRRAETTSSVLLGILEQSRPSTRWGLNE